MSLKQVINRLQSMIRAKKGKWIVSEVKQEKDDWLSIDGGCLKEIIKEHPEFTVSELRIAITGFNQSMKYKKRKIFVAPKQSSQDINEHQGA